MLSTWGEVMATVRLPPHWESLRPGEEIEDLKVALRIVNAVKEEEIWSGQAFQTAPGKGNGDPEELVVNEAAVQNGEGPVFLEAFVAKKLRPHQRDGVRFMFDAISKNRGAFWQIRWAWVSHCKPWPCCGWCSRTTWWRRR